MARTLVFRGGFTLVFLVLSVLAGCRSWDRNGGSSGCGGGCCRGVAEETAPLTPRGPPGAEAAADTARRPGPDAP